MTTWISKRMGITGIELYEKPIPEEYSESGTILSDSGEILLNTGNTLDILTSY